MSLCGSCEIIYCSFWGQHWSQWPHYQKVGLETGGTEKAAYASIAIEASMSTQFEGQAYRVDFESFEDCF